MIATNAVIDYLDNKFPEAGSGLIDGIVPKISVITRMELLGWTNAEDEQLQVLQQFIIASIVYSLDEPIIVKTTDIRKAHKIKLPDAIIAATALAHDLTLLTRNVNDFNSSDGLRLINLHER